MQSTVLEAYATMNKTDFLDSQSLHWGEREEWEEMDQKAYKQINKPSVKCLGTAEQRE